VANGEHLAMKAVEPAGVEPPGDRRVGQPQVAQLSAADDAVLPGRHGRKPFCVMWCPTVGHNSTQLRHPPMLRLEM
jgi:hypothetical protein